MKHKLSNLITNSESENQISIFDKFRILLLSIIFFISIGAWMFWQVTFLNRFLIVFFIILSLNDLKKSIRFIIPIFILILYFVLLRGNNIRLIYSSTTTFFLLIIFLLNSSSNFNHSLINTLETILAAILIPSLIYYFVSFFVSLPYSTLETNDPDVIDSFQNYYLFIKPNLKFSVALDYFRFNSIFNEPGVVGTVCLMFLFVRKFKIDNWKIYTILFAGIASFSFFFYVGLAFALIYVYGINLKKALYSLLIILSLSFILQKNEIFEQLVLYRFQALISGKDISTINKRTPEKWDIEYNAFLKTDDVIFGRGENSYDRSDYQGLASYQQFVYLYGFWGLILLVLVYFYMIRKKTSLQNALFLMTCFLGILYQRPWIFEPYVSLIIFSGASVMTVSEKKNLK